jgi:predicted Zn-dependent protease
METLPPPHHHTLNAAQGWLELGLPADAQAELDHLPAALRTVPVALHVQFAIHAHTAAWDAGFVVADTHVRLHPADAGAWIHRAYAARRKAGGSVAEAFASLSPAADLFPAEPVIPYNLACYCAQQGEADEAWRWLERARKVGDAAAIHRMALADDDLRLLWPQLAAEKPAAGRGS